jgi:endonuclease G
MLDSLQTALDQLESKKRSIEERIHDYKLDQIRDDLRSWGLPTENYIEHSAMFLSYNEEHEQANWVAHIILPDIVTGSVSRTNDFRLDPKIETGSAEEADYFLKYLQMDSSYVYDGYGYDRGHLAPSADFRWSEQALSESYYYSNMSPQRPGFNRYSWAELEGAIRSYVYTHSGTSLYVVSGPLLDEELPKVERSVNGLSLPEEYFKIVVDLERDRGIGFIMPNRQVDAPIETFALSIREVENRTKLDFSSALPKERQDKIESQRDIVRWLNLPDSEAEPLSPTELPKGHFNTVQAKIHMGKNRRVTVCGRVVSMRKSKSGNIWLNMDKTFPNHIFSAYIPKEFILSFTSDPMEEWLQKDMCIEGKVQDFDKTPTVRIERSSQVKRYNP